MFTKNKIKQLDLQFKDSFIYYVDYYNDCDNLKSLISSLRRQEGDLFVINELYYQLIINFKDKK